MLNEDINFLTEKIRELETSKENIRRNNAWKPITNTAEAYWHGRPQDGLSYIPFTIEPEHEMWGKILGFPLDEYYNIGLSYLLADLNMKVYRFEHFSDETPIGRTISLWMGAGFEASLFGMEQKYTKDKDPWLGREPILKNTKNLDVLPVPDFFESPVMKNVHIMFQDIKKKIPNDFNVVMPEWCRGPFGLACHLRGMDQIMVDMIEDPVFVQDLMRLTTDTRKKWTTQRAVFMGAPVMAGSLYNDEVNVPMISPNFYEKFVLPYETELSDFYGGITYWHSCGNIVQLENLIKTIPNLEMVHISPWSNLKESVNNFRGSDISLEVVLHPLKDVQSISIEGITNHLTSIRETTAGLPVTVRADGLQLITSLEGDLNSILQWAQVAREVLGE
jgi:hypothetical protein